jgi:ribosome-binding factor A
MKSNLSTRQPGTTVVVIRKVSSDTALAHVYFDVLDRGYPTPPRQKGYVGQ